MSDDEREQVLKGLQAAVDLLAREMDPSLIPEVGTNIAYAIEKAKEPSDVAAVEGRIVRVGGKAHPFGRWGSGRATMWPGSC